MTCRAKYTAAAEELLELLTTQQSSQQAANARANELVDVLLSCEGLPFQEQLLGPGPWLVRAVTSYCSSSVCCTLYDIVLQQGQSAQ
jgi:hypothetical protein